MKTSIAGIVSAVVLTVVAGIGFGIAQAGGDQPDNPAWTLQDQEAVQQYQDFAVGPYTEDRPVLSFGEEMRLRNPTETGGLPDSIRPPDKWGESPSSNRDDIDGGGGGY
jgi:hypothetical protein